MVSLDVNIETITVPTGHLRFLNKIKSNQYHLVTNAYEYIFLI